MSVLFSETVDLLVNGQFFGQEAGLWYDWVCAGSHSAQNIQYIFNEGIIDEFIFMFYSYFYADPI